MLNSASYTVLFISISFALITANHPRHAVYLTIIKIKVNYNPNKNIDNFKGRILAVIS